MKSVLDGRPSLAAEIWKVAETAGYLWLKGWAERNGGNIVVNITEFVDDEMRSMPAISITEDCRGYEIVADNPVLPTSELPSHLSVHNDLISKGSDFKASLHTHPIELVAMSHNPEFLKKDVATRLLWSMIPETKAFCPKGLGITPYQLPGSVALAQATIDALSDYDVVMWEKHGVFAVDKDIMAAFDQVDVLNKSAQIYIAAKNMGFVPDGMTDAQMREMSIAFNLPK